MFWQQSKNDRENSEDSKGEDLKRKKKENQVIDYINMSILIMGSSNFIEAIIL